MSEYLIRFANMSEIDAIMNFIDKYWKKNHILAKDRALFEWQYINNGKLNMVIGANNSGDILGILGYIPYSDKDDKDFALALWKVIPGTAFLGVKLLLFLLNKEPHRNMFCNGINVGTSAGIYQRLGIQTGRLTQYYRLNDIETYRIACIKKKIIPGFVEKEKSSLKLINGFEDFLANVSETALDKKIVPYKSLEYIKKRYFNHPKYEYLTYVIENRQKENDAVIVLRLQDCNNARALRVIDIIGNYSRISEITDALDNLADTFGAEYVDMYVTGIESSILLSAGWLKVGDDSNIIPNYFAPYTPCNVDINICMTDANIVLFKGDGDQDRPN